LNRFYKEDIEKALEKYPDFRDELFDKLYSFFKRYFSESGCIYFNSTPFHNNIYEKVYTEEKDVVLFWKTQMLYYVKTDRIFRSMPVELEGFKFYFDASKIDNKKANEKRSLVFRLGKLENRQPINFNVSYSEKGTKTKTDDILSELRRAKIKVPEEVLERAFRTFEKQSEVDYFINKNANSFLKEQFSLWSYQYFWEGAKDWSPERINQLQILKDIAYKVIDFIAQFEDELVKIWNKPKFVRNSNYVITLDRIKNTALIEKILNHKNIHAQIKEWQELGIVDEGFVGERVFEEDSSGKHLAKSYEHLPIDTKYFKDVELELLSQFEELDKSLDGWLIKSENYQALNTILPKFKEKVQTIYIDPPFNLDSSDQFLYRTNYKDANWATLLENRLRIAKDWLNEKGGIFVRCDYNGNWIVRNLLDDILENNFVNEIVVGKTAGKKITGLSLAYTKDNIFFYAKDTNLVNETIKDTDRFSFYKEIVSILEKQKDEGKEKLSELLLNNLFWVDLDHRPGERQVNKSRCLLGIEFQPPKGRHWIKSQEKLEQLKQDGKARIKNKIKKTYYYKEKDIPSDINPNDLVIQVFLDTEIITDNWTDINGYSQSHNFQTENSEILLKRVICTTKLLT